MFAKHKEAENFNVKLQNDVVVPAVVAGSSFVAGPSRRTANSSQNSSKPAPRGGSTSVGTGKRVHVAVEEDACMSADDEERLYPDVIRNLRQTPCVEIQYQSDSDDEEEEDRTPVEWNPANPLMAEGCIFSSMAECRNALVTYCMKVERAFVVDKSDKRRYTVHCVSEDCQWRMHASKMLAAPMFR
jgi:hypothetical protein